MIKNQNDMKKLFLMLIMTATVANAWAQSQLSTVRGKTKDGKTIKVDYYKGTVEDVIQSVKFQLVDELQAEVKDLQGKTKTLQGKVDDANKQIKDLQSQLKNAPDTNEAQQLRKQLNDKENEVKKLKNDIASLNSQIANLQNDDMSETLNDLRTQLTAKETTITALNKQVTELNTNVTQLNKDKEDLNKQIATLSKQGDKTKEIQRLNKQVEEKDAQIGRLDAQIAEKERVIDSLKKNKSVVVPNDKDKQLQNLREQIATQDATITNLNKQLDDCRRGINKPAKTPVIGLEVGMGPAFTGANDLWAKETKGCLQADVYFGTARLSEDFPISIEAGLGVRNFGMSARLNDYAATVSAIDADGDSYQAIYAFYGLSESLTLTYLDIPIRLCFGQPAKDRVSVYAKVGLTPSINVASKFEGKGTYSLKGYYPQWDVTLENIAGLGFGSDMDCYTDATPDINTFNLWGNVAVGAYVPFKGSPIVLNAGLKVDYPFMSIGSIKAGENLPNGATGLLNGSNKVVIPAFEIGLVYILK